jgi:hypothetical protein
MPAWQGNTPITLDSLCSLDVAARGEIASYTLTVIAPLPSSGLKVDAVTERQS